MKKTMKKALAAFLVLVMLSSTFVCFAAELNQDAVNTHKGQYKNYVLLGDSVASGYRDVTTDDDADYNRTYRESAYYRVPGSYADVLTKAIIEDDTMIAFAGPGFRTVEVRYMLEDDFAEADEFMFYPSNIHAAGEPGSEAYRTAYKKAVAEADLITLGVGGNDWGAYLGWVVVEVLEKENAADEYIEMARKIFDDGTMDVAMIEQLVTVAHIAGALPALAQALPAAVSESLKRFYSNWDIMIQDIYDLNPDVTLMVIGMSDNSLKGKYFDYNGVVGEPVSSSVPEDEAMAQVMKTVIDAIMTIGNKPMIDGAEKFGYTYVDTAGTTYIESHPDADGHIHIANKIIEALPDPVISKKFDDVKPGHKYYNAVEYVIANGIMSATSETTFSPDAAITTGQLTEAFNAINGTDYGTANKSEVNALEFAVKILTSGMKKGLMGFIKSFSLAADVLSDYNFNLLATVTRGEAASYLKTFCEF